MTEAKWKTVHHTSEIQQQKASVRSCETITIPYHKIHDPYKATLIESLDPTKTASDINFSTNSTIQPNKTNDENAFFFEKLIAECDKRPKERIIRIEVEGDDNEIERAEDFEKGRKVEGNRVEEFSRRSGYCKTFKSYVVTEIPDSENTQSQDEVFKKVDHQEKSLVNDSGHVNRNNIILNLNKDREGTEIYDYENIQSSESEKVDNISNLNKDREKTDNGPGSEHSTDIPQNPLFNGKKKKIEFKYETAEARNSHGCEAEQFSQEQPIYARNTYKDWGTFKAKLLKEFQDAVQTGPSHKIKEKYEESSRNTESPNEWDLAKVSSRQNGVGFVERKQYSIKESVEQCKVKEKEMEENLERIRKIVQDVKKLSLRFPKVLSSDQNDNVNYKSDDEIARLTSHSVRSCHKPAVPTQSSGDVVYITEVKFPVHAYSNHSQLQ